METVQKRVARPFIILGLDKTLINVECDAWIISQMGLIPYYDKWREQLSWPFLMDKLLEVLHSNGITIHDIVECLKAIPMDCKMKAAIRSAYYLGSTLKIIGDTNRFFIETILKRHELDKFFSEIISHGSEITMDGRIRVIPYHFLARTKTNFSPNCLFNHMFKEYAIENIKRGLGERCNDKKVRFIYAGDGFSDHAPVLKLLKWDFIMARRYYPLWRNSMKASDPFEASVHEWENGDDFERVLLHLVNVISYSEA